MNLLLVARRFPPDVRSGSETVFANLYEQALRGNATRLVAGFVRDRALLPAAATAVDLRGKRLGMAHVAMVRATRAAASRQQPDAILSNSIEVSAPRWPTVCIVHDLNFGASQRTWTHGLRERYYRQRSKRLARIVTPSQATAVALEGIGVPSDKITVIHNGVDLATFCPAEPTGREAELVLCYPGRILPGKGQHVAIDAVARLPPELKARVHLRIVGAVADQRYIDQLKVQARHQPVSFHPDVDDIVPYYQQADAVLYPTLMIEGFGFTAVEAMACGVPVLWSEQPAIREATGGIGHAVPMDDPVALRDRIAACLDDREALVRIGRAGRTYVEARYDWTAVWARYEAVLQESRT
jgi:glycosyltransferase involved in cell wall biosynthesis